MWIRHSRKGADTVRMTLTQLTSPQDGSWQWPATVVTGGGIVLVVNEDDGVEFISPAARRLCGLAPDGSSVTPTIRHFLSPDSCRLWWQVVLPGARRDGMHQCELTLLAVGSKEVPVWVQAVRVGTDDGDRIAIVAHDVSAGKRLQERLRSVVRVLRVLNHLTHVVDRPTDEKAMLMAVCRLLTKAGGYRLAFVGLNDGSSGAPPSPIAWAGDDEAAVKELAACEKATSPPIPVSLRSTVAESRAVVERDLIRSTQSSCAESVRRLGLRAMIKLPLTASSDCLGTLSIYSARTDQFDSEEVDLLRNLSCQVARALHALRELLAHRESETKLQLLAAALEATQEGMVITDAQHPDHPVVYVNAAVARITGWETGDLIGRSARRLAEGELRQSEMDVIRRALRGRTTGQAILRCYRKDGQPYWSELKVAPIRGESTGDVTHYVSLISDVTRRVYHEDQLAHLATHDLLTGLANRTLLYDRLLLTLTHAERHGSLAAVLLFDLDNFRQINEGIGRQAGDLLLRTIARRALGIIQEGDTVARLGSDEFVLLLTDRDQRQQIVEMAAALVETLAQPQWLDDEEVVITPSIGVAIFPTDTSSADDLLRLADIAMSEAKTAGGNNFRLYTPDMLSNWPRRSELERDLRRALERAELVLHYQPKADLYSGNCTGVEALVRWQHPERGMIAPAQFIPLAEASGLIVPIGRWVLQEACREIVRWQSAGVPPMHMAVNLSPQQLGDENLVAEIVKILEATGASPRQLELEITESTVMANPEVAAKSLHALREMGIRLAMDDFGTGHSSLGNLRRFPFDVLKIDRSFVHNVTTVPEDATIATTVISMAHNLGMRVIAEGVEKDCQMSWLRNQLCDEIQGYYLGMPMSGDQILPLLRTSQPLLSACSSSDPGQRTLLLVDDEPDILRSIKRLLRRSGYRILTATSATSALDLLAANQVQVIVSDQRMPLMSGAEFLSRARALYPDAVRIMLTGYSELSAMTDAINRASVSRFMTKPWDDDELRQVIHDAFVAHGHRAAARSRPIDPHPPPPEPRP